MSKYDVIVIGGGHNGLAAAVRLSRAGKRVAVLERREVCGGLASRQEFIPGYTSVGILQDTTTIPEIAISSLQLKKYGLEVHPGRTAVTLMSNNEDVLTLHSDADRVSKLIAPVSEKDARAYHEYTVFIEKLSKPVRRLLYQPQRDLANIKAKDYTYLLQSAIGFRRMGKAAMLEFLKVAPMSVADFLNERFETELLKAGLIWPALLSSFNGPWSSYTTLNLLLWECTSSVSLPRGPASLTDALVKAAEASGVDLVNDKEIEKIVLSDMGSVEGVRTKQGELFSADSVIATCTPAQTFLDLLDSNEVGPDLEADVTHIRSRGVTAKLNLALNRKVKWNASPDDAYETVRLASSLDHAERAFDCVKYGQYSAHPVLEVYIPSISNPELAPEGHEVVSILIQYVPYELRGGWTKEACDALADMVIQELSRHVDKLPESLVGHQLLTPVDLEREYGLTGGNLFHAEHAVDQIIGRPVPQCADYSTPVPGLFLGGSGSHPGGGLTCMPGILAAETISKILSRFISKIVR